MCLKRIILGVVVLVLVEYCNSANILVAIPVPSFSHQVTYRELLKALAKRGHHITFLTTDPMAENVPNIRQIDWHEVYSIGKMYNITQSVSENQENVLTTISRVMDFMGEALEYELCHPEVQQLINGNAEFDLVMAEYLMSAPLALGAKLNCPTIGILSLDGHIHSHATVGNPVHPIANPDFNLPFSTNLTFVQRLYSVLYYIGFQLFILMMRSKQDAAVQKCLGDVPPSQVYESDISMLFINANPIFTNVRSLGPATINVGGGIHIAEPKPLSPELQNLLDSAKDGAIYFSLGSNVKSNLINNNTIVNILDVFKELPYKILWKFEDERISGKSANVYTSKWFPQNDVLRHPNVKLFITQGGLQSMEEGIINKIPMIGIPFFGDQFNNVNKMVEKGFGISLDSTNITKATLKDAILEIMNNQRYRGKVGEISNLLLDQPMTGLEKAVWWTEYVIRHRGARNLRNPVLDIPLYQYFFLDIMSFFLVVLLVTLSLIYLVCKLISRLVFKLIHKKEKTL